MDGDVYAVARPGQGLVDGIVHHFIYKVMERLRVCPAHVHTRAAADGLEALQDLDTLCIVVNWFGHWVTFV
jgi:hypothetical protein